MIGKITLASEIAMPKTANSISSARFNNNGNILATGHESKSIKLWDVDTGTLLNALRGHNSYVASLCFNSNDDFLASGGGFDDPNIIIWNISSGLPNVKLEGHEANIYTLAFSPDCKYLASGSGDCTIKLWEVETGKLKWSVGSNYITKNSSIGHSHWVVSVVFSSDGDKLISAGLDSQVKIWDVKSGFELGSFNIESNPDYDVQLFTIPNTSWIAINNRVNVLLLDSLTGRIDANFFNKIQTARSLAFDDSGKICVFITQKGFVEILDFKSGEVQTIYEISVPVVLTSAITKKAHYLFLSNGKKLKLWKFLFM